MGTSLRRAPHQQDSSEEKSAEHQRREPAYSGEQRERGRVREELAEVAAKVSRGNHRPSRRFTRRSREHAVVRATCVGTTRGYGGGGRSPFARQSRRRNPRCRHEAHLGCETNRTESHFGGIAKAGLWA